MCTEDHVSGGAWHWPLKIFCWGVLRVQFLGYLQTCPLTHKQAILHVPTTISASMQAQLILDLKPR